MLWEMGIVVIIDKWALRLGPTSTKLYVPRVVFLCIKNFKTVKKIWAIWDFLIASKNLVAIAKIPPSYYHIFTTK